MNDRPRQLVARIRSELIEIERVLHRVEEGWRRAQSTADDYYLDSVALNLHGFYSGLERLFERIVAVVDGSKPSGENWHQVLLQQVSREAPGIWPAVISEGVSAQLDEYRGFRHVVRNVYTFSFEAAKVKKLVENVRPLFTQVSAELLAFAEFIEQQD
ncbi:MAG TPA: hypothetical protein VNK95_18065 [Caldilineaceae bacterium]|nr:hypothetical protein [Caldilineaceae bacterium]